MSAFTAWALTIAVIFAGWAVMFWRPASAEVPLPIRVIDADTFDAGLEENVRVPDVDGPELRRYECEAERDLARLAKAYGQELVDKAETVELRLTGDDCGWDRPCGDLVLDGERWSDMMMAAGYLKPWPHRAGRKQAEKPNWCEAES